MIGRQHHLIAYDRQPRFGGIKIAVIKLLRPPWLQQLSIMPDTDYYREGFEWIEEHPEYKPRRFREYSMRDVWWEMQMSGGAMWVVEFKIIEQHITLEEWTKLRQ